MISTMSARVLEATDAVRTARPTTRRIVKVEWLSNHSQTPITSVPPNPTPMASQRSGLASVSARKVVPRSDRRATATGQHARRPTTSIPTPIFSRWVSCSCSTRYPATTSTTASAARMAPARPTHVPLCRHTASTPPIAKYATTSAARSSPLTGCCRFTCTT